MRQTAARMIKIAEHAEEHGVTKTAKKLLTYEGNETVDYSFRENFQK